MPQSWRLVVCVPKPRHACDASPRLGQHAGLQIGGAEIALGNPEPRRGEYNRDEHDGGALLPSSRPLVRKEMVKQAVHPAQNLCSRVLDRRARHDTLALGSGTQLKAQMSAIDRCVYSARSWHHECVRLIANFLKHQLALACIPTGVRSPEETPVRSRRISALALDDEVDRCP